MLYKKTSLLYLAVLRLVFYLLCGARMTTTEMFPKEAIEVEEQEKKNVITLTTPLGDTIRMEVTGINRSV